MDGYLHVVEHGEELRVLSLYEQSSRIVVEVSLPVVKLTFMQQYLIVVAFLKQPLPGRFLHIENPPICLVAP